MSQMLKLGAGAAVFGALALLGHNITEKQRAEAIERYSLNEASIQTMEFCESSMSANSVEFTSGVDEIIGCACIANEFSNNLGAVETPVATSILRLSHKYGAGDDADPVKFAESIMELQDTSGLNEVRFERAVTTVMNAVGTCSKHETHMTEDQRTAVAENKKNFYEDQKAIMDKAVRDGHMTREDADRRLARMKP